MIKEIHHTLGTHVSGTYSFRNSKFTVTFRKNIFLRDINMKQERKLPSASQSCKRCNRLARKQKKGSKSGSQTVNDLIIFLAGKCS